MDKTTKADKLIRWQRITVALLLWALFVAGIAGCSGGSSSGSSNEAPLPDLSPYRGRYLGTYTTPTGITGTIDMVIFGNENVTPRMDLTKWSTDLGPQGPGFVTGILTPTPNPNFNSAYVSGYVDPTGAAKINFSFLSQQFTRNEGKLTYDAQTKTLTGTMTVAGVEGKGGFPGMETISVILVNTPRGL